VIKDGDGVLRSQAIRVCAELAGKYPPAEESYSLTGHSNPFPAGERLTQGLERVNNLLIPGDSERPKSEQCK
jgi:hypothetical protein